VKVWTCTEFAGHYPVGTAAIVVAETAEQAADELNRELRRRCLSGAVTHEQMREFETETPGALVLADGDY